jgi:hypothetical protein
MDQELQYLLGVKISQWWQFVDNNLKIYIFWTSKNIIYDNINRRGKKIKETILS